MIYELSPSSKTLHELCLANPTQGSTLVVSSSKGPGKEGKEQAHEKVAFKFCVL